MPSRTSTTGRTITFEECEFGRFHRCEPSAPPAEGRGAESVPGIVLVHDVWGLSEHSQALAADLAGEGFAVLEIDLYRSLGAFSIEDPGAHIRSLSDPAVTLDLEAGADWLAATAECRARKIGVVGVCMGGMFTLLAACLSNRFAAAAPFYGILSYEHGMLADPEERNRDKKPLSPLEAADRLRTPILASFGREDQLVPETDVERLEAAFASTGVAFTIDRYAGAGHAFLNHTRPGAYHAEAATRSWSRVIPFLHAELD